MLKIIRYKIIKYIKNIYIKKYIKEYIRTFFIVLMSRIHSPKVSHIFINTLYIYIYIYNVYICVYIYII